MDFSKINDTFSKEIIRGREAYLDGQLKIATSSLGHRRNLLRAIGQLEPGLARRDRSAGVSGRRRAPPNDR